MRFRFSDFEVDSAEGRLLKHGVRIPLREQPLQVLLALLDRPGEVVTRVELRERLWKGATTVDFEAGLNTAISRLRHVLKDTPGSPRFIETVPKRGYRFIGPLPPQMSIAVLPLDSHPQDTECDQIADAVTEELIRAIGRIDGVRVASRSAVLSFKRAQYHPVEAARSMRVAFLVEGSVRRVADSIRIHVHLVNGEDGFEIWSDRFDGQWRNVLYMHDQIATALSAALQRRLLPPAPHTRTANSIAYAAYSKGHFLVARHALSGALECFQQAMQSDPDYALPYHGAAVAHVLRALMGQRHPKQEMDSAESVLARGLQLAPDLAFIQNTLGMLRMFQWKWAEAETAYNRAISAEPHNAYAHMMFALHHSFRNRHVLALRHAQTALALEPLDPMTNFRLVQCLYYARDFDAAVTAARSALELAPFCAAAHSYLGWALLELGNPDEAWTSACKARHLEPDSPLLDGQAGYVAARTDHAVEAQSILSDLEARAERGYCPAIATAWIYLGMGDSQAAITWLTKALEQCEPYLASTLVFPGYDLLRSNTLFQSILDRINPVDHSRRP